MNKRENWWKEFNLCINVKNQRFVIGVVLAVLSIAICLLNNVFKAGVVFSTLFLMISFINVSGEIKKIWQKIIYTISFFIIAAFITIFLSQLLLNESTFSIGILRLVLGMNICIIIYLFIYLFTFSVKISVSVGSCAILFFTLINYYVWLFRGSELNPSDILSIGTAANVANKYKFVLNSNIIYAWLAMILFVFLMIALPKCKICHKKIFARIFVIASECIIILLFVFFSQTIQTRRFLQEGSVKNGYLLNFTLQIKQTIIHKPEKYMAETIASREDRYSDVKEEKNTPDIIVIMDESFADLSVLGSKLRTNKEVSPFIDSLSKNTVKGYALSSIYGGGTPNSEYEFLSGNSAFFLPQGSIVYQQYIKNQYIRL